MISKRSLTAVMLALCLLAGKAQAQTAEAPALVAVPAPPACTVDADCHIVTSYEPPDGDRPGKTLARCAPVNEPLAAGESLREYNEYLTSKCVCMVESRTCGMKD